MILLDQCVPRRVHRIIENWGYNVDLLTEHIPATSVDADVVAKAQELDAVLLTVDLDFANIIDYPPEEYGGLIVMRYDMVAEAEVMNTLKNVLETLYRDDLRKALVIVEPDRYRIRNTS